MKLLRHLLTRAAGPAASRFDRYYTGVLRSGAGAGYPTADEARQDLRRIDAGNAANTWLR